jgi:hypothetical protein
VASKCQQAVEKSVKAIAAELSERGVVPITIGFDHAIDRYIKLIRRAPGRLARNVPGFINETLDRNAEGITWIMDLAPRRPPNTARLPRNTEYPFHDRDGVLVAPAAPGTFGTDEIERCLRVGGSVFKQAAALITLDDRKPR